MPGHVIVAGHGHIFAIPQQAWVTLDVTPLAFLSQASPEVRLRSGGETRACGTGRSELEMLKRHRFPAGGCYLMRKCRDRTSRESQCPSQGRNR